MQRRTNENTNGLVRQYLPKGTNLTGWATGGLEAVAHTLNSRPRKTFGGHPLGVELLDSAGDDDLLRGEPRCGGLVDGVDGFPVRDDDLDL